MRLCRQFQIGGFRAAFSPVQQFRNVQNRLGKALARSQVLQAADIAADQHIRLGCRNVAQFAGPQLCGQIRLQDGTEIGTVQRVMTTGGVDVLEIGEGGKILIPFAESICVEVDLEKRQITIDPPEGLLQLNAR